MRSSSSRPEAASATLLKDRVLDVDDFLDAARRVNEGGSALDPEVVATLLSPKQRDDTLAELTPREQEVLALMAEGRTNAAIAKRLWLTEKNGRDSRAVNPRQARPPDQRRRSSARARSLDLPACFHRLTSGATTETHSVPAATTRARRDRTVLCKGETAHQKEVETCPH